MPEGCGWDDQVKRSSSDDFFRLQHPRPVTFIFGVVLESAPWPRSMGDASAMVWCPVTSAGVPRVWPGGCSRLWKGSKWWRRTKMGEFLPDAENVEASVNTRVLCQAYKKHNCGQHIGCHLWESVYKDHSGTSVFRGNVTFNICWWTVIEVFCLCGLREGFQRQSK